MEGISCPRKHILNYSETRYMESWETSNKKYQPGCGEKHRFAMGGGIWTACFGSFRKREEIFGK